MFSFLTASIREQLIDNFELNQRRFTEDFQERDFKPVVKLFTPDAQCTWLLTELDPETNIAFGLCDLGWGMAELGYVSLEELNGLRGGLGLAVERDENFAASNPLSWYKYRGTTEHVQIPRVNGEG